MYNLKNTSIFYDPYAFLLISAFYGPLAKLVKSLFRHPYTQPPSLERGPGPGGVVVVGLQKSLTQKKSLGNGLKWREYWSNHFFTPWADQDSRFNLADLL